MGLICILEEIRFSYTITSNIIVYITLVIIQPTTPATIKIAVPNLGTDPAVNMYFLLK